VDGIRKRIYLDLFQRSGFGVVAYLVLMPLIFYSVDLFESYPAFAIAITALVLAICGFRVCQIKLADRMYERHRFIWFGLFSASTFTFAAILSTFFVLSAYHPDFKVGFTLIILICAGVSSGSITSLAPAPAIAIVQNLISLVPPALVNLCMEEHRLIGIGMLVYLCYNVAMALKINKEYLRAFSMEQRLQVLSQRDQLTGLYNRGHFESLLQQMWLRATRSGQQINIVMMDIDHFKSINDSYGHSCGDVCLKRIAELMTQHCRRGDDLYCRYGGEEFVIAVLDDAFDDVLSLIDSFRDAIASDEVEYDGHRFTLTASFGVATKVPSNEEAFSDLINQADAALYRAKEKGRNRVEVFDQSPKEAN